MSTDEPAWLYDNRFDGADTGCGELLIDLKIHFRPLAGGTRVLVIARDAGAPEEMPAWCRMTKHGLLDSAHPYYLIAKRED